MDDARHEPSERGHPVAAAAYDLVNAYAERRVFPEHRRYLARDLRGEVLDLGAGTGAMFPYFRDAAERRPSLSVTAVDPDPHMRTRAERSADELGLNVAVRPARAESLPFADGRFDAVVASLVFCTIPEPERALAEIRRVLEPGGEFRFFEHVRSPGWLGGSRTRRRRSGSGSPAAVTSTAGPPRRSPTVRSSSSTSRRWTSAGSR